MSFLDELKRLARPYEDEEEDYEEFEPAPKLERKQRERATERLSAREPEPTTSIFDTQAERRSNKVVNIHTTTQLQVVLVKPDRFEAAPEIADHLREKRTVVLNLESVGQDVARRLAWPMPAKARSKRWPSEPTSSPPSTWTSWAIWWVSWRTTGFTISDRQAM